MPAIIPASTAAAQSASFTLADGQNAALKLNAPLVNGAIPRDCSATVEYQTSGGAWLALPERIDPENPAMVLAGAGTYRVVVAASNTSFGVDKD